MHHKYEKKVVLVTGTSKGLGKLIAGHFINHGAKVIGVSRGKPSIDHVSYRHYSADIGKADEVFGVFKEIKKSYSSIDILVNNAAVLTSQYSLILAAKNVSDMVNINLLGTFFVSRETVKLMRKNLYGRIINISSMAVKLEPMGDSIYAATKAGINTLANVMAKEFSSMKITCNTLGITAIETDMLNQLPKEKIDEIIRTLTIPRYAVAEDVFNVIDFFSSAQSSYITAQTVYLGGIN